MAALGILATTVWCGVMTWVLLKVIDAVLRLRVTDEHESVGLDQAQHGESGYNP